MSGNSKEKNSLQSYYLFLSTCQQSKMTQSIPEQREADIYSMEDDDEKQTRNKQVIFGSKMAEMCLLLPPPVSLQQML